MSFLPALFNADIANTDFSLISLNDSLALQLGNEACTVKAYRLVN